MHTEEQAKQLWCPMVRAANGRQASNCTVNVGDEHGPHQLPETFSCCVASACAVWRWAAPLPRAARSGAFNANRPADMRLGHCGLAGAGYS